MNLKQIKSFNKITEIFEKSKFTPAEALELSEVLLTIMLNKTVKKEFQEDVVKGVYERLLASLSKEEEKKIIV